MTNYSHLFKPLQVGSITVPNRVFLAPMTRCRADVETNVPNDLMVDYYTQRANAGLVITEAVTMKEGAITFHTEGCIYNNAQAEGWKRVVDSVHARGGKIFCQIAHGGRAAHPLNNGGNIPVAPSPIALVHGCRAEFNPSGEKQKNVVPRELVDEEIPGIVDDFVSAARRCVEIAGFDGVEIHGASGYLINQFTCAASNKRESGPYRGETMGTRCKFLFDILEGVIKAIGNERVALRISPTMSYQDMHEEDPIEITEFIASKCDKLGIAYLHVVRGDMMKMLIGEDPIAEDVVTPARKNFKSGPLVVNLAYDAEEAEKGIAEGKFDAVAFGSKFLANPDLPERILTNSDLNEADMATFYTKDAKGYTDYPTMRKDQVKN